MKRLIAAAVLIAALPWALVHGCAVTRRQPDATPGTVSTALTPAQVAQKAALCTAFNSNAVGPTGVPLWVLAAGCPWVTA